MKDSKLINLLRTLSDDEFVQLEKFAKSPYHNEGRNYVKFFAYLRRFHPDYENRILTLERVYGKIYPGKKFSKGQMNNLLYRSAKITLDFISSNYFASNKVESRLNTIDALIEKCLLKEAIHELSNVDKTYTMKSVKSESDYFKYKAEIMKRFMEIYWMEGEKKECSNLIQQVSDNLIYDFIIKLSKNLHGLTAAEHNFKLDYSNSLTTKFINHFDISKMYNSIYNELPADENGTLLKIYLIILKAHAEKDFESNFLTLKKLILNNLNKFSPETRSGLYSNLQVFCNILYNNINPVKYLKEYFIINKKFLEFDDSLFNTKRPAATDFRNIVTIAVKAGEYKWTERFMEKYSYKIPAEMRETIVNFSYALIHNAKKNYKEALNYLNKVNVNEVWFKIDIKAIQMKIYYELGYSEEALCLADTFKHFLNHNSQVSSLIRDNILNHVKAFEMLVKLKDSFTNNQLFKLKYFIEHNSILGKNWLVEKLKEFDSHL